MSVRAVIIGAVVALTVTAAAEEDRDSANFMLPICRVFSIIRPPISCCRAPVQESSKAWFTWENPNAWTCRVK